MAIKKNLANCTPTEFVTQTYRIKKAAEKWLKATDIIKIRRNVPKLDLPDAPEAEEQLEEYHKKLRDASYENLSKIIDVVMGEYPRETVELLGLVCFVEPKDVDKYKMTDYLTNLNEIINDEAVLSFFTSLMRLGRTNTLGA